MLIPPALRERGIDRVHAWSIPMTTRFRRITERDGLLLHGPEGWAEFSPFWDYDAAESTAWLRAALEDATTPRPAPRREEVEVNATIPVLPPVLAARIATVGGARTAKVKVADPGSDLASDAQRLEAVRDAMGPDARIRIDANAAWTYDEALEALPVLDRAAGGLEYAEQPCAALEDLAALRRALDIPVAADESVRRAEDPLRVARAEAADLLVMKVQPLGGVTRCLELAEEAGLPVVVSSALESSIGLGAGLALAALSGRFASFRGYIKFAAAFLGISFLLGGALIAVFSLAGIEYSAAEGYILSSVPVGIPLFFALVLTLASRFIAKKFISRRVKNSVRCVIYLGEKKVEQFGFFDSGNRVYSSGVPVSVISRAAASCLVDENTLKESVKVRTVAGERKMKIFTADKIEIYNGDEAHTIKCVKIGISPRGISRAVLHPDLAEHE